MIGLGHGIVVTIPKPGKSQFGGNLRLITLLNNVHKINSLIILERIQPAVEEYLESHRSGFRRGHGTFDVIWAHCALAAIAQKFRLTIHVLGINLSKAFDTVD